MGKKNTKSKKWKVKKTFLKAGLQKAHIVYRLPTRFARNLGTIHKLRRQTRGEEGGWPNAFVTT